MNCWRSLLTILYEAVGLVGLAKFYRMIECIKALNGCDIFHSSHLFHFIHSYIWKTTSAPYRKWEKGDFRLLAVQLSQLRGEWQISKHEKSHIFEENVSNIGGWSETAERKDDVSMTHDNVVARHSTPRALEHGICGISRSEKWIWKR